MNQQSNDFATYDFLDLSLPKLPNRSRIYPLEPRGIGTPYVESLTSYIVRLAQAHGVTARTFIIRALGPMLKRQYLGYTNPDLENVSGSLKQSSQAFNGTGKLAEDFVQALETLTLRTDLRALTFLSWAYIFPISRLHRRKKAWCPECFSEWQCTEQPLYEPLLWQLQAITSCPKHQTHLVDKCPYEDCRATMAQLSGNQKQLGYCTYCLRSLGLRSDFEKISFIPDDHIWNDFASEMIGELLVHNLDLGEIAHLDNVSLLIDAYLEQVVDKKKHRMGRNVDVGRHTLNGWQNKKSKPQLYLLLRLCYCSGISLFDLVSIPTMIFQTVKIKARPLPASYYKLTKIPKAKRYDIVEMRKQLEKILKSKTEPPLSMHAVGRLLGRDPDTIRKRFQKLARAISHKYLDFHKRRVKKANEIKKQQVYQAVFELKQKDIYPSFHKVQDQLGSSFSLNRRLLSQYWNEGMDKLKIRRA